MIERACFVLFRGYDVNNETKQTTDFRSDTFRVEWDRRARQEGLYAVMSRRWTVNQCLEVHAQHVQILMRWLSPLRSKRILDVGCGTGRLSAVLAGHGAKAVGLDENETMLTKARHDLAGARVQLVRANAACLPFPDGVFDAAIGVMVLQHILSDTNFECALREIARVTTGRGRILLVDGTTDAPHSHYPSSTTIIRPINAYEVLSCHCRLLGSERITSAGDEYTIMVWTKLDCLGGDR